MSQLDEIEARVNEAEAKRAQSRRNPDPIFDAGMMLAIQASSADVPYLLALVREQAAKLAAIRELHAEDLFRGHLSNGCKTCGNVGDLGYPCPTITALEATK